MNSSNAKAESNCQIVEKLAVVSSRHIPFSLVWVREVLASESTEKQWNRNLTLTRSSHMFSDTQSLTCPCDSFVSTVAPARPWQMVLINVDTITRFTAINIHSSYGFKCWGFQIMWLTGVGEGASGRWFEVEDGWSKCELSLWVENTILSVFICAPDSHRDG